ncbi:hypothetical protein POM88_041370 [Heracleum sosnowskyi]|uniref:Uncharacterized protein n=1 Tax=Heracleum sosnowskyi TaxID=360622 RepID=A0AAD8MAP9_9APIA|nr:hypothetical protein POM88_041370 [Heracleum sosnowskyi]
MAAHRPACKAFGYTTDPAMHKYTVSGPSREAVPLAVANSGINSDKIRLISLQYHVKILFEFYALILTKILFESLVTFDANILDVACSEMGFSSINVEEVLLMYNNETDKAVAHHIPRRVILFECKASTAALILGMLDIFLFL